MPGETGFSHRFDRTNAILAALVFVISFIVYAMTVQRTFSFWDCGEFIACSYILGIPHPPGTPLFVMLGRLFSLVPTSADIAHRVNYMSVLFSAITAMLSYLLTVKLVRHFFPDHGHSGTNRYLVYLGGLAGAFFVAFGATNWANAVETEVYAPSLALSVGLIWLTVKYWENQGTSRATRYMLLVFYLAMLGIGVHMTEFLVMPICALFFIMKKDATPRDWMIICGYAVMELLLVIVLANGRGGYPAYLGISVVMIIAVMLLLYRKINWGIAFAVITISTIMIGFGLYLELMAPLTLLYTLIPGTDFSWSTFTFKTLVYWVVLIGGLSWAIQLEKKGIHVQWRKGLAIIFLGFLGFSVHLYLPIRSQLNPRIDENHPARDWRTFVNMLDRKQYGQESMVARMFHRRGAWSNQFGRHAHMGFWSYFEEQYSPGGWVFVPFFLLGLLGMIVAIRRRLELGIPFMTLLLLVSVGLILYMNFADGTHYNPQTGDAYLEVRNRDYFFTPAFVFFGIAMGMGVTALLQLLKEKAAERMPSLQPVIVYGGTLLLLLPVVSLEKNYHINDRSLNRLPYNYAANLLDSCDKDAIIFTSGDNDTFPVWCLQEVYNYRKDVRVVNLSLLNTDWYVRQMRDQYNVPISLTDEQILWYPYEAPGRPGTYGQRPKKQFPDRPRKRMAYLEPSIWNGKVVRVQDMMVDEIVIENNWKVPIYFSAPPYADSPLNLRKFAVATGIVYKLKRNPDSNLIDVDTGYNLYMNTYRFGGYQDSKVYRDENATGVFLGVGMNGIRIADELMRRTDTTRALTLLNRLDSLYPEYWQIPMELAAYYDARGDSATSDSIIQRSIDSLAAFHRSNKENLFYLQDLGLLKAELGRRRQDQGLIDEGINLMWAGFEGNPNSSYAFRKLVSTLSQNGRYTELRRAAKMFTRYGVNRSDPIAQRILQSSFSPG
ncbi:MAG: DUF2723 domain-containing protein [Candidatus Zixiibacteriota bacterium]|nr:MAG: DUF2723 domain-containing protein [candidate division Zixibacteria bacterium]